MRTLGRTLSALVCSALLAAGTLEAQATAHWYIGTYTNDLLVWDEASEEIVDRIRMRNPIPRGLTISENQDLLYVRDASGRIIEVVDLDERQVIDEFTLDEGNTNVRINSFAPHPSNDRALMQVMRYTKLLDRYSVEGPFIVEYDLRTKEVTDTVSLPDELEADQVGFRYAPDGETLYIFSDDIILLDPETYEEVDRWELSQPIEPGLGRVTFATAPQTYDEPGVATALFRMTDPAQNRRLMGISRTRLSEREVDFFVVGESEPVSNFALAPGGERAYALYSEIGHYEFWEFDLVNERVARRQPFEGRPRMGLEVSADGEKLYVHVAGNTIDVYDVDTFELLRTVEFDEDMTVTGVVVLSEDGPGQ